MTCDASKSINFYLDVLVFYVTARRFLSALFLVCYPCIILSPSISGPVLSTNRKKVDLRYGS